MRNTFRLEGQSTDQVRLGYDRLETLNTDLKVFSKKFSIFFETGGPFCRIFFAQKTQKPLLSTNHSILRLSLSFRRPVSSGCFQRAIGTPTSKTHSTPCPMMISIPSFCVYSSYHGIAAWLIQYTACCMFYRQHVYDVATFRHNFFLMDTKYTTLNSAEVFFDFALMTPISIILY